MENFARLREQARALEQSDQHRGALDLYRRMAEEAEGAAPAAAVLSRVADLHLRLGETPHAVASLLRSAELFHDAGLSNVALSLCHRALRLDPAQPDAHLALARLAAAAGYPVDAATATSRYVELAEQAGDAEGALAALREVSRALPHDRALRRLLDERLPAGSAPAPEEAPPAPPAAEEEPGEVEELPGLMHSGAPESGELAGLEPTSAPEAASILDPEPLETEEVAPLEGLEPTRMLEDDAPLAGLEPTLLPEAAPEREEESGGESLPLLGLEPHLSAADDAPDEPAPADALPLLGTGYDEPEAEPVAEPVAEAAPGPEEPAAPSAAGRPEKEYVDLGAMILDDLDEEEGSARFVVDAGAPSGDEARDFEEILGHFRQQVSENLEQSDTASHYDLGFAFKEMGLLDDAITHFETALRGGANLLGTLEALGECYVEKGEPEHAERVLLKAVELRGVVAGDLAGVYYWLGRSAEARQRPDDARAHYRRVVDAAPGFRDAAERLGRLPGAPA